MAEGLATDGGGEEGSQRVRKQLRLRLRKNHHHDHHITVTDQSPTNSNNSTTPQQSAAVLAQVQDKGRHHSRPTGMPTYWCHSDKLHLGRCDSFRRKGWGVCRACWVDKIEGKKELEEAYRSWWTEEKRTHFNASDEKVWPSSLVLTPATPPVAPPPPPSTSSTMLDDMRDMQPPKKKQRHPLPPPPS